MGYEVADVVRSEVVALHHLDRNVGHVRDGGLEDGLPVLRDGVPVVADGLFGGGIARTSGFHIEVGSSRTVRMENMIDDAVTFFVGFEQYGRSAVAENGAGFAVGVVDDRRHLVRTHDDHLLAGSRFDEFRSGGQCEEKSAASGGYVVGECLFTACFACDEVSRRREEHVGRDRRADDEIDLFGVHVFLFEQIPYRFDAHVRGAERFAFEDMAGFDADACHDPLVGGIHHTAQFVVGKDVIREVSADACDCSSDFSHL